MATLVRVVKLLADSSNAEIPIRSRCTLRELTRFPNIPIGINWGTGYVSRASSCQVILSNCWSWMNGIFLRYRRCNSRKHVGQFSLLGDYPKHALLLQLLESGLQLQVMRGNSSTHGGGFKWQSSN